MVAARAWPGRETVIRVNAPGTAWFDTDFKAACAAGPDAILIPKVDRSCTLFDIAIRLREADASPHVRIWAMNSRRPGRSCASPRSQPVRRIPRRGSIGLVMGLNDLAKETRARFTPERESMLSWLQTTLIAARTYGLDILDGVCNAISDAEAFEAECRQGRDLGFDGKSLIHPAQIGPANSGFRARSAGGWTGARNTRCVFAAAGKCRQRRDRPGRTHGGASACADGRTRRGSR